MAVIDRLQNVLKQSFPDPDKVELRDEDGVFGSVVSTKFEGVEMIDRINMIWDIIDQHFSLDDRRDILTIVPATPEEAIVHSA